MYFFGSELGSDNKILKFLDPGEDSDLVFSIFRLDVIIIDISQSRHQSVSSSHFSHFSILMR